MFDSTVAKVSALMVVAILLAYPVLRYLLTPNRPPNFPPGPSPLPLIGNLHQIPPSKPFLRFTEWTKVYGDIIGLHFGSQPVVVLNSYHHVREIFEKRGAIYSGRPYGYIPCDLVCPNDVHILFMGNTDKWRRLRSAMHLMLGPSVVDQLQPIQDAEASLLLLRLLEQPNNYVDHFQRWSVAVIMLAVFGERGESQDADMVKEFFGVQKAWAGILEPGGAPPVDIFPVLRLLPESVSGWKRKARWIRDRHRELYFGLLEKVREKRERSECLLAKVIRAQSTNEFSDEQIAYLGGFLLEAGSDTTSTTALSFLLALVAHPQIQKQARQEVDAICGSTKAPDYQDISQLPYLRACLMEVLRWRPTLPAGVPHVLDIDDTYQGYQLPAGTMVIANAWSIHHTSEIYDDLSTFDPTRYLKSSDDPLTSNQSNDTCAFGAGRRICPGDRFAENGILIAIAKVLWAYEIRSRKPVDASVETGYDAGLAITPKRLDLEFVRRSEERIRIMWHDHDKAEKWLAEFAE